MSRPDSSWRPSRYRVSSPLKTSPAVFVFFLLAVEVSMLLRGISKINVKKHFAKLLNLIQ